MKTILPFLMLLFCGLSYSQTTITGSVVDDSSQPIPGANVIIVGTVAIPWAYRLPAYLYCGIVLVV